MSIIGRTFGLTFENQEKNGGKHRIALMDHVFGSVSQSTGLTFLFGAFVFLQFAVLGLANHAGEGYLTPTQRDIIYYALQVFVILGYLLYSLFFRFCRGKRIRGIIGYSVCGIFFFSMISLLTVSTDSLFHVIVSMLAALTLGGLGGATHHRMSLFAMTGIKTARCMGIGSAAAVLLQYLLQFRWGVTPLLRIFMPAAFLLLLLLLPNMKPEEIAQETENRMNTPRSRIVFSALIASAFILFTCFYNEYIHHLQIQSNYVNYTVYSWPRLMLVPGYLLFAVIGDKKNGRYVPIASLCMILAALLNTVLVGEQGAYWLNMCLFYFAIAAHTSYYILTFWRLAPGTKNPAQWAPFGRVLDSAMVLFSGAIHLSELPAAVVLGTNLAGLALIILLMAVSGNFNLFSKASDIHPYESEGASDNQQAGQDGTENTEISFPAAATEINSCETDAPLPLSPEETLKLMQEKYQLTSRETEVFRELVLTEDKQSVICERLSIRIRTLQYYVTNIYHKTGASTRSGLTELYYSFRQRNQI